MDTDGNLLHTDLRDFDNHLFYPKSSFLLFISVKLLSEYVMIQDVLNHFIFHTCFSLFLLTCGQCESPCKIMPFWTEKP